MHDKLFPKMGILDGILLRWSMQRWTVTSWSSSMLPFLITKSLIPQKISTQVSYAALMKLTWLIKLQNTVHFQGSCGHCTISTKIWVTMCWSLWLAILKLSPRQKCLLPLIQNQGCTKILQFGWLRLFLIWETTVWSLIKSTLLQNKTLTSLKRLFKGSKRLLMITVISLWKNLRI